MIYGFNTTSVKTPRAFSIIEMEKLILKFIWKCKNPQRAKKCLGKKEESWRTYTFQFQNYLKAPVTQTRWEQSDKEVASNDIKGRTWRDL